MSMSCRPVCARNIGVNTRSDPVAPIDIVGATFVREVEPGELVDPGRGEEWLHSETPDASLLRELAQHPILGALVDL